jgi:hypothetical protein
MKDSAAGVDIKVVLEVVVQVVWDKVTSGVVCLLLAAAGLGMAVLTVSLLSKQLLGACWARR